MLPTQIADARKKLGIKNGESQGCLNDQLTNT